MGLLSQRTFSGGATPRLLRVINLDGITVLNWRLVTPGAAEQITWTDCVYLFVSDPSFSSSHLLTVRLWTGSHPTSNKLDWQKVHGGGPASLNDAQRDALGPPPYLRPLSSRG